MPLQPEHLAVLRDRRDPQPQRSCRSASERPPRRRARPSSTARRPACRDPAPCARTAGAARGGCGDTGRRTGAPPVPVLALAGHSHARSVAHAGRNPDVHGPRLTVVLDRQPPRRARDTRPRARARISCSTSRPCAGDARPSRPRDAPAGARRSPHAPPKKVWKKSENGLASPNMSRISSSASSCGTRRPAGSAERTSHLRARLRRRPPARTSASSPRARRTSCASPDRRAPRRPR